MSQSAKRSEDAAVVENRMCLPGQLAQRLLVTPLSMSSRIYTSTSSALAAIRSRALWMGSRISIHLQRFRR
jgi:hypothetical protein